MMILENIDVITSKQLCELLGITQPLSVYYGKLLNVKKFGNCYAWSKEDIEKVKAHLGKQRVTAVKTPRRTLRCCFDCSYHVVNGKKRLCVKANKYINKVLTKSPTWCPLGFALKKG